MTNKKGLTLVEVLIALAVIGMLIGVFSLSLTSSLSVTETTGQEGQINQLLNQLVRRVVDGETALLSASGQSKTYDYGQLSGIISQGTISDLSSYKASIVATGSVSLSNTSITQYTITICSKNETEKCLSAVTFGPSPDDTLDGNPPGIYGGI